MRAAIFNKFGGTEVLEVADVEKPRAKADEVLVKVRAGGGHLYRLPRYGRCVRRSAVRYLFRCIREPGFRKNKTGFNTHRQLGFNRGAAAITLGCNPHHTLQLT